MNKKNTKVILNSRPDGEATSECFSVIEEELVDLSPGEVRIANELRTLLCMLQDAGTYRVFIMCSVLALKNPRNLDSFGN